MPKDQIGFAFFENKMIKKGIQIMRLAVCLTMALCMQVSAKALSQKTVSLEVRGVSLQKLFTELENKTSYRFLYSDNIIPKGKVVNISVKGEQITKVLDLALTGSGLSYRVLTGDLIVIAKNASDLAYLSSLITAPPPTRVSGKVTDEKGQPVADVSVMEKGTTKGVRTNESGEFTINVDDENAVLQILHTGYETVEISLNGRSSVNIKLKEKKSDLEEIVVVGYGSQKKVNLTGAVAQLSGKQLENRPVTNVGQALQGQIASLNISANSGSPGSSTSINIRGYSGLGTTNSPLIVIDGIPGGSLDKLNPNDIENISVLKDAASAAIYGQDGAYGVILVTTKTGKAGKLRVTYNNNFGLSSVINLPTMLNSIDFATIYNEACDNAGRARIYSDATIQKMKDYQEGKIPYQTGSNYAAGTDEWLTWGSSWANNDWFKVFYKDNVFSQQHNLSLSGGSEKMNYFIGAGYNGKNGMFNYGHDSYDRYNVRANIGSTVTDWMKISFRTAFSHEDVNTPNSYSGRTGGYDGYMHQIARKWPTVPLKDSLGNYTATSDIMLHEQGGRTKYGTDEMTTTGEFQITPLKGWNITGNYTYKLYSRLYSTHQKAIYEIRPSGASVILSNTAPSSFRRYTEEATTQTVNLFSSYEKQVKDHYFKVMVGFLQNDYRYTYVNASNTYPYSDDVPALSLTYGTNPSISDEVRTLASQGIFSRVNYNYKEKILLEFNGRYDATSRFMDGYRWVFNPGVSAAYIPSKEEYWQSIQPYINTFKVRASYASLGDQVAASKAYGNEYYYYPFYSAFGTTAASSSNWLFDATSREAYVTPPSRLASPTLTWVNPVSYGVGVDMTFLRNKLSASIDWFKRRTKNLIVDGNTLPSVLGTNPPLANRAEIEVNGFEVSIDWKDQIGNVTYQVKGVLSDYSGKVIKNPANSNKLLSTYYDGMKLGEIWGYQTIGLFQTADEVTKAVSQSELGTNWGPGDVHYANLDGDDKISAGKGTVDDHGDRKVIGNSTPRYSYGLTLAAQWKGFDASIFFQGVAKADAWVGSNYFWGITGDEWQSSPFTTQFNDRWTPTNPGGYYPKYYMTTGSNGMGKNTVQQTRYLQNAAYLRIKNLQLGYTLPQNWVEKAKLEAVKVFFSVDNLATFTKFVETIDPEFYTRDGGKVYPLQRTYSFGINLTL